MKRSLPSNPMNPDTRPAARISRKSHSNAWKIPRAIESSAPLFFVPTKRALTMSACSGWRRTRKGPLFDVDRVKRASDLRGRRARVTPRAIALCARGSPFPGRRARVPRSFDGFHPPHAFPLARPIHHTSARRSLARDRGHLSLITACPPHPRHHRAAGFGTSANQYGVPLFICICLLFCFHHTTLPGFKGGGRSLGWGRATRTAALSFFVS